jgi:hypothetical protein
MARRSSGRGVLVDNAADPQQVARADRIERERAARDANDARWVLSTPVGRRFVRKWLIERTGVYRSAFAQDPIIMAGLAAVQQEGQTFIAYLEETCPERYEEVEREARAERVRTSQESAASHAATAPADEASEGSRDGDAQG